MPYQNAKTLAARAQVQPVFVKRAAKLVGQLQCLIVSADPERLEMFQRAAAEGGWKTFLCADAPSALTYINRSLVQLAVVDLDAQQPDTFRSVVERLAPSNGLLLIVCGNEGDVEEEVWVRQRGAWLYLPGVVDSNNFALLCGEARHIAERLSKPSIPQHVTGAPVAQRKRYS